MSAMLFFSAVLCVSHALRTMASFLLTLPTWPHLPVTCLALLARLVVQRTSHCEKSPTTKAMKMKPIEESMEDDVFESESPTNSRPAPTTTTEDLEKA
ncbi:hypothetical protein JZ751_015576 [Albula glossodonta]|uniref:Secreted protein n=1 Tax=Albula glossodonta TaxID=121402 RepID=A0A8T2NRF4_9TELE|nr:hypothetical protein JZ751_015576 [Albula glossodonta]